MQQPGYVKDAARIPIMEAPAQLGRHCGAPRRSASCPALAPRVVPHPAPVRLLNTKSNVDMTAYMAQTLTARRALVGSMRRDPNDAHGQNNIAMSSTCNRPNEASQSYNTQKRAYHEDTNQAQDKDKSVIENDENLSSNLLFEQFATTSGVCNTGCPCPFPCGPFGNAKGCCCLPPPCNCPAKCIQYMTGYYYYPYGIWFCGPYHVTGLCCPGGPCPCAGGPCGPCGPCPGGPCGPTCPGCVCCAVWNKDMSKLFSKCTSKDKEDVQKTNEKSIHTQNHQNMVPNMSNMQACNNVMDMSAKAIHTLSTVPNNMSNMQACNKVMNMSANAIHSQSQNFDANTFPNMGNMQACNNVMDMSALTCACCKGGCGCGCGCGNCGCCCGSIRPMPSCGACGIWPGGCAPGTWRCCRGRCGACCCSPCCGGCCGGCGGCGCCGPCGCGAGCCPCGCGCGPCGCRCGGCGCGCGCGGCCGCGCGVAPCGSVCSQGPCGPMPSCGGTCGGCSCCGCGCGRCGCGPCCCCGLLNPDIASDCPAIEDVQQVQNQPDIDPKLNICSYPTCCDSPQMSPPQMCPPQMCPPQMCPPQMSPPQMSPPQMSPPQMSPPQMSPAQMSPPQMSPPQMSEQQATLQENPAEPQQTRYKISPSFAKEFPFAGQTVQQNRILTFPQLDLKIPNDRTLPTLGQSRRFLSARHSLCAKTDTRLVKKEKNVDERSQSKSCWAVILDEQPKHEPKRGICGKQS